ncbi:MAG TPA: hypothetical protein VJT09_11745 [Pyrinomonadaceae bacterium]|nr:hypothetical protein [Pyrinomonadaceae bacterium]
MKRCPTCQRTYPDDAPGFCSADGTPLVTEGFQAYPNQPPQPPQANQPPPANWQQQQPPQGQNVGGYYPQQPGQPQAPVYAPQYPPPYVPSQAAGKSNGLALASFILGIISFLAVALIFLMSQGIVPPDRDVAGVCFYGSAALGLIAIVLGTLALISKRLRNRWMAILGLVLGIPGLLFFVYVLITYGL